MIRIVSQSVPDAVRGALQAINDGDSDGLRNCFHHQAVIDELGRLIIGTEAIRLWCIELFERRGATVSNAMIVNESPVRTAMRARVGWDGADESPGTFTFDVENGLITMLRISD
ncbi:nuclear transport factor 2 family protein [uncultured Leifsonia sp.]|uniref:nuclear transport factor 2 family protein n=1 Tax=uncultured Leifsonia sp. TaxID=340359 RepID=UPI0028D8B71F|nr:nuclear transport factor 2 family protein [uncultured Leifsonia sp.]